MKERPWWARSVVLSSTTMVVGLAGCAVSLWALPRPVSHAGIASALVQGFALLLLGAIQIAQSARKDAKDEKKESVDELRGCLSVIHRTVAGSKGVGIPPEGWLRITLHRVDGEELEQSVEYVGSDDRDKAGRRFAIRAGLIGVVARTGQVTAFERPADMDFVEWCAELVRSYGMTDEDAKTTRNDRHSFFGVPIKNPGGREVRAVVYLDAAEPSFFAREIADLIVHGCEGLAAWIDDHYYT